MNSERQRLQKVLSQAGVCSRRRAEELMRQGRVLLNGRPASPGDQGDPLRDRILVDGELVQKKMRVLQILGDPYSDAEIAAAAEAVAGKTELDALVEYLQNLGTVRSAR